MNGQKTCLKIDTGAQCNVISRQTYHQLGSLLLQKSLARLVAFGGQWLSAYGKATTICQHKGKTYHVVFEAIDQDVSNILGLLAWVELNLVQRLDAINTQTNNTVDLYSDIFEGLGCITGASYHIKVDSNAQPVSCTPTPVTLHPKVQ